MKNKMQRTLLFLVLFLSGVGMSWGQKVEKSFSAGGKSIDIALSNASLIVEGHNGSNLIIETEGIKPPPERAKGLRPLFNDATDNTGLGLQVEESGNAIRVKKASNQQLDYRLKVPKNAHLKIEETSWMGGEFAFKNLNGEVEVKSNGSRLKFEEVSGPIVASSTSGEITVVFSELNTEKPTAISNVSGIIDISLPSSTKANLELSSISGEIYTDLDIKTPNSEEGGMKRLGGPHSLSGTLNGGGVEISLKAISSNIYIREKK